MFNRISQLTKFSVIHIRYIAIVIHAQFCCYLFQIYHCNINSNGRICHSSLDTKYVPRVKVKTLLEYIYGLLMSPEPLDPLDR